MTTEPNPEGLDAARRLAGWEIGHSYWADLIIEAYLNPESQNESLDAQGVPSRTGVF